jgi:hypothetical protein
VAERVVGADGDQRQVRVGAIEEIVETGVGAAVMGDLEDVDRARVERDALGLRVRGQEHREAPPAGEGDDGKLVRVIPPVGIAEELRRRPDHLEPQPARSDDRSGRDPPSPRPALASEAKGFAAENRVEHPGDRGRGEQFRLGAIVVGLIMGEDQRSETVDSGVLELGRDPVAGGSGIDEDGGRTRGLEQDRVALADVEHRDPQAADRRRAPHAAPFPEERPEEESDGGERDCR